MPQAKLLIEASLSGDIDSIRKAIKKVDYYLRRNRCAYISHRKKLLLKLELLPNTV
jgi:hypothetical protein